MTITRTGVNRVRVDTSTEALVGMDFRLENAMGRILGISKTSNLLIDPTQRPTRLDYSPSEVVSFSGARE